MFMFKFYSNILPIKKQQPSDTIVKRLFVLFTSMFQQNCSNKVEFENWKAKNDFAIWRHKT